jgi:hypothetical protein
MSAAVIARNGRTGRGMVVSRWWPPAPQKSHDRFAVCRNDFISSLPLGLSSTMPECAGIDFTLYNVLRRHFVSSNRQLATTLSGNS